MDCQIGGKSIVIFSLVIMWVGYSAAHSADTPILRWVPPTSEYYHVIVITVIIVLQVKVEGFFVHNRRGYSVALISNF